MHAMSSIGRQTSLNYLYNVNNNKTLNNQKTFSNVLNNQINKEVTDRFNNYSIGIMTPPVLLDKLKVSTEYVFEDVTNHPDFEHLQECGPYRLFRTYLDNGEGNGRKVFYNIRLKTSSRDVSIDSKKLQDIFDKAITVVNKMIPIYAKMSGTAILEGIDYTLPFNETTGEIDFETFVKDLVEGTNNLVSHSLLDDDMKAELQRMLKECEDFLMKSLEDKDKKKYAEPETEHKIKLLQPQESKSIGNISHGFQNKKC